MILMGSRLRAWVNSHTRVFIRVSPVPELDYTCGYFKPVADRPGIRPIRGTFIITSH
jgi:hypothetical protein